MQLEVAVGPDPADRHREQRVTTFLHFEVFRFSCLFLLVAKTRRVHPTGLCDGRLFFCFFLIACFFSSKLLGNNSFFSYLTRGR